jgi:hypothetical protein
MAWVDASEVRDSRLSNQDQDKQVQGQNRIWSRLFACALCHTEFHEHQIAPSLPEPLHSALLPFPIAYGFVAEMHSFLHRMAIRRKKRFGAYFLWGVGPSVVGADGLRHLNIRGYACTNCMKNYAVTHPWATILDLETYRDAWLAGAEWAENNSDKAGTDVVPHHS